MTLRLQDSEASAERRSGAESPADPRSHWSPRRREGEEPLLHDHIHAREAGSAGAGRLWAAALITLAFAGLEAVAGTLGGSLALVSDAGHTGSDSLALILAAASARLAMGGADSKRTFGWAKAESVAGLVNAAAMLALIGWIGFKAIERLLGDPMPIDGPLVAGVGAIGLAMNLGVGAMLMGAQGGVGVRSAMLHAMADALGSAGAVAAGVLYWAYGWAWIDPALSIGIALLVGKSSWALLRETFDTLIDAAPSAIDVAQAHEAIEGIEGVAKVLDLHIWQLSPGEPSLSAHLKIAPGLSCQPVILQVERMIEQRFGIRHSTIQPHEES